MKKFISIIMLLMFLSSVYGQTQGRITKPREIMHLNFLGIDINGSEESFANNLKTAGYKTWQIDKPYYKGIGIEGTYAGIKDCLILPGVNDDGLVEEVNVIKKSFQMNELIEWFDKMRSYIRQNYKVLRELNCKDKEDDDTIAFNETHFLAYEGFIRVTVKDYEVTARFVNFKNSKTIKPKEGVDISDFVTGFRKCHMYYDSEEVELNVFVNNDTNYFSLIARSDDANAIKSMIFSKNATHNFALRNIMSTYVATAAKIDEGSKYAPINCCLMDRVLYEYNQAINEQKRKAQKAVANRTPKDLMAMVLKNMIFSKEEQDYLNRVIPEQMQNRIIMGIIGSMGGNGTYEFNGQKFNSEAEMQQWKINNGYGY